MSTIEPDESRAVAAEFAHAGSIMLDGPLSGSPVPLAAAANEMMNACRGLGIDANDFVVAHQFYRRLGGQE
jgi:hypothetical protein